MTPETILIALLGIYPYMSGNNRQCLIDNQPRIVQQLQEVTAPYEPGAPVPPLELTAAVAFAETHLGCDAGEGGGWGAPIDRNHRNVAGTHLSAVRSLSRGYRACRTWDGAVMWFRTGVCNADRSRDPVIRERGSHYIRAIRHLIERMGRYIDRTAD